MYDVLIDHIPEALGRRGRAMNTHAVEELTAGLHPSDLAFIFDELSLPETECVFAMLDDARAARTLSQVAPETNRHLIQASPSTRILSLLRRLPMDEVAEVVSEASEEGWRLLRLLPNASARLDAGRPGAPRWLVHCNSRETIGFEAPVLARTEPNSVLEPRRLRRKPN